MASGAPPAPGALPPPESVAAAAAARGEEELLLLFRSGDGHCACLSTAVVPELRVCLALASDYEGKPALQLDLDDL